MAGRPRQFAEQELIETAQSAFWANGYRSTSVRSIARDSGVLPGSIHQRFGSKHHLFLAALEAYANTTAQAAADLRTAQRPLDALRDLIAAVVDHAGKNPGDGCMLGNSAIEFLPDDRTVQRVVDDAFDTLRDGIRGALDNATAQGLLSGRSDWEVQAEMILAVIQGLHITTRARRDPTTTTQVADALIDLICAPHQTRPPG